MRGEDEAEAALKAATGRPMMRLPPTTRGKEEGVEEGAVEDVAVAIAEDAMLRLVEMRLETMQPQGRRLQIVATSVPA